MNDYQPCAECGELEAHAVHYNEPCNNVGGCDCHEYVPGCYCADRGKCSYCVERAVDAAEAYGDTLRGK